MNKAGVIQDAIPQEDFLETSGPNEAGMVAQRFFAFNTAITLQAFAPEQACLSAFGRVRKRLAGSSDSSQEQASPFRYFAPEQGRRYPCRDFARHSRPLERALSYCADSDGRFDITMGAAVQLWDLRRAIIPSQDALREAAAHVDWRGVRVREESGRYFAPNLPTRKRQSTSEESPRVDRRQIHERASQKEGLEDFLINLGGNVVAHGKSPAA